MMSCQKCIFIFKVKSAVLRRKVIKMSVKTLLQMLYKINSYFKCCIMFDLQFQIMCNDNQKWVMKLNLHWNLIFSSLIATSKNFSSESMQEMIWNDVLQINKSIVVLQINFLLDHDFHHDINKWTRIML